MMKDCDFALNDRGYITDWLVSGPAVHPFTDVNDQIDQLAFEAKLRGLVRDKDIAIPPIEVRYGERFFEKNPWHYHDARGNWFVEFTSPGGGLKKVDACAATCILSPQVQTVRAVLWTYAAIDMWVGEEKCTSVATGVYKPIIRQALTLRLDKGLNQVFIRLQALAVRDPRNIFGLQLLSGDGLAIRLPDEARSLPAARAAKWLQTLTVSDGMLRIPAPPCEAALKIGSERIAITGEMVWPAGDLSTVIAEIHAGEQTFTRTLEFPKGIRPVYLPQVAASENHHRYDQMIGSHEKIPRGPDTFFSGYQILARFATGDVSGIDYALLYNDLSVIEARKDCSEFIAVALLRLANRYDLGTTFKREMKRVFLGYRYWMDEPGDDGMCFWSENHALMFYGTQLVAGAMYPDDVFSRSGRTGREQHALARARCNDWLDDVLKNGFEEFLSANYVPVTLGALVNLIDFGPEEIAAKARAVLDMQMEQFALHVFKGSVIAPQGRTYREVIDPFHQDFQGIVNYLDGCTAYVDSWWLSALATSGYASPLASMEPLISSDADTAYQTGNARIVVYKRPDYMLTSAAVPSGEPRRWENRYGDPALDASGNEYVKSLNEKFHGTSYLTPGQYGYQQHLWYAALDSGAIAFTNHPGTPSDGGSSRPGYWHGNGVMPAQKQEKGLFGQIYCIDEAHPIDFVHLYFPMARFDEVTEAGLWRFARLGEGYLAIWSDRPLTPHDDVRVGCEWRANGRKAAFVCAVSSAAESGSFADYQRACGALAPAFDPDALTLTTGTGFRLRFTFERDATQVVP